MKSNYLQFILEDSFFIAPQVKHFRLKSLEEMTFLYKPGQFITIHFEYEGSSFKRSYSIANAPQQDGIIELAAGYVDGGPGSKFLFELEPGAILQVTGPYGRLLLREQPPKRYILIGTSTGITPYRAMLPALGADLELNKEREVVILQGVRHRNAILYRDDFLAFQSRYSRVNFTAYLSREEDFSESFQHEKQGHVQNAFAELNLDPDSDLVYLCGNPAMVDECFTILKDKGFAVQQIVREKYSTAPAK